MVGYGVTEERSKSTWWRTHIQAHTSRLLGMVESSNAVGHSPGKQRSEKDCQRRGSPCLSVYGPDSIMNSLSTLTIVVSLAREEGGTWREGRQSPPLRCISPQDLYSHTCTGSLGRSSKHRLGRVPTRPSRMSR